MVIWRRLSQLISDTPPQHLELNEDFLQGSDNEGDNDGDKEKASGLESGSELDFDSGNEDGDIEKQSKAIDEARESAGFVSKIRKPSLRDDFVATLDTSIVCEKGVSVYRDIAAKGFEGDLFIGTSLVNMFCKMGRLDNARKVFDKMPNKDTASWNVMISGLLQSLHPSEAVEMFWKMNENVLDLRSNKVSALLVEEANRTYDSEIFERNCSDAPTQISRMLALEYWSNRSYLGLEYYEGTISIKIMLVGIHMGQIESVMKMADEECKARELKQKFEGKTVLLGIDDMDIFKGINLKILVMEQMLKQHPKWQGRAVLVQIVNPTRAVRDGMNLMPYEYTVCRQGSVELDKALGVENDEAKKSVIIVSEFIGCPPSLSCAIRVNLWNICL
ncbi:hypothetical protein RYX36_005779 [Vicia faba]